MKTTSVQFGQYIVDISDFENIKVNGKSLSVFSNTALVYLLNSKLSNIEDQDIRRIVIGIKLELEKRANIALSTVLVEQLLMHGEMISLVAQLIHCYKNMSRVDMTNLLIKGQTPKTGEFKLNYATVYLKHVEGELMGFADHQLSTWEYGTEVVPYCVLLDRLIG